MMVHTLIVPEPTLGVLVIPPASFPLGLFRIRDFWHRPDDVLAGLVLGAVCAFWSFRFVVVMPFNHEIGAPEWTPEPTWVLEEEDALLEDSMMGCWKVGRKRPGGVGDAGAGGGVSRAPRPRVVHGESPAPLKFDSVRSNASSAPILSHVHPCFSVVPIPFDDFVFWFLLSLSEKLACMEG